MSSSISFPVTAPTTSASPSAGLGPIGPNGIPDGQYNVEWGGPLYAGQTVCSAGLYNVTDACCAMLHGALWVPDAASAAAADMFGAQQHMCLLFSNATTANTTIKAFRECAGRPGTGGNIITGCYTQQSSARARAVVALGMVWVVAGCVLAL